MNLGEANELAGLAAAFGSLSCVSRQLELRLTLLLPLLHPAAGTKEGKGLVVERQRYLLPHHIHIPSGSSPCYLPRMSIQKSKARMLNWPLKMQRGVKIHRTRTRDGPLPPSSRHPHLWLRPDHWQKAYQTSLAQQCMSSSSYHLLSSWPLPPTSSSAGTTGLEAEVPSVSPGLSADVEGGHGGIRLA